ncbi:MAG: hypothetical protein KAU21_18215, partial [Gammaproteobacteria bacterium]|nr:hypothetical protein [Gammaproteobacteria bacterium]
ISPERSPLQNCNLIFSKFSNYQVHPRGEMFRLVIGYSSHIYSHITNYSATTSCLISELAEHMPPSTKILITVPEA